LGSQNGTIVNNQVYHGDDDVPLRVGDFVQIGSIQFQLTLAKPTKPAAALDDKDIAGWLSDGDSSELNTSDTTVIKIPELKNRAQHDPKQKFESVTEEAQDIIRRHMELKQQE
jgi:pSer/pThr/pTyr-binding forkhead associated (FHA) protein